MKKSLLLAVILFCFSLAHAQNELLVQGTEKSLYLNHTVSAGQNFYSVGRLYNVSAKEIAALNSLDMTHGLNIGQVIRIPLNGTNFNQGGTNGRPVYYVVGAAEGLYRVSLKNNKVLMANLRKWNHLSSDNLNTGQKLIIGYLISPEANNIVVQNSTPPAVDEVKTEVTPAKKEDVVQEKKEEPKKIIEEKKEEPKKIVEEKRIDPPPANPPSNEIILKDTEGGYFKSQFGAQLKSQPMKIDQTASAGIFKTASGWQDLKYYALMDKVEPGTIIRITNPSNNKSIYAKVLGQMSGIRQNQGYDVRISNAAASALDISETDKFIVRVNY
ncbi:MAG: LysM peptidoglycan-binding domain-containing protein [Flavisolibacter sp.]